MVSQDVIKLCRDHASPQRAAKNFSSKRQLVNMYTHSGTAAAHLHRE